MQFGLNLVFSLSRLPEENKNEITTTTKTPVRTCDLKLFLKRVVLFLKRQLFFFVKLVVQSFCSLVNRLLHMACVQMDVETYPCKTYEGHIIIEEEILK